MFGLVQSQCDALVQVYQDLIDARGERVYTDEFIAEIERRVAVGLLPPIFTATKEEAYQQYQRRIISSFFAWYDIKYGKNIIGVIHGRMSAVARRLGAEAVPIPVEHAVETPGSYYVPIEYAQTDHLAATALRRYFEAGLTSVEKYVTHLSDWNGDAGEVLRRLDQIRAVLLEHGAGQGEEDVA